MKATALRKKFDTINKAIGTQIDKIYSLAEEFTGEEIEELLIDYADKLSDLVLSDESEEATAFDIINYIDNEMIPIEVENNEEE